MDVMHKKVVHCQFGIGVITNQNPSTVTVAFAEPYGERKFLCPNAFGSFLELCDSDLKAQMHQELQQLQEQAALERQQHEEENRMRLEESRRILLEQKRSTAKKRTSIKKVSTKPKKQKGNLQPSENKTVQ